MVLKGPRAKRSGFSPTHRRYCSLYTSLLGTLLFFPIKETYFSAGSLLITSRCAIRGIFNHIQLQSIVSLKHNPLLKQSIHYSPQLRYVLHEVANYYVRLNSISKESTPKRVIMAPEILLIHRSHCGVIFFRSRLIPLVRIIHHKVEPENTPSTTVVAEKKLLLAPPTPIPAKIAAKERIVSGLVSVSKNVEAYAPK